MQQMHAVCTMPQKDSRAPSYATWKALKEEKKECPKQMFILMLLYKLATMQRKAQQGQDKTVTHAHKKSDCDSTQLTTRCPQRTIFTWKAKVNIDSATHLKSKNSQADIE